MSSLLYALLAAGILALWWRDTGEARDRANAAVREACAQSAVQLLDGTVAFQSLRVVRTAGGLAVRRTYQFDYSEDGASRRHGFIVLLGRDVEMVGLGPTLVPGGHA